MRSAPAGRLAPPSSAGGPSEPSELAGAITSALRGGPADIEILDVRPWRGDGTAEAAIVDCRLDGRAVQLFCKHSNGLQAPAWGHRGGTTYEADVYRSVLSSVDVPVARFFGCHVDESTGAGWIFLEHLAGAASVDLCRESEVALDSAAGWAGRFHAATEHLARSSGAGSIRRYDASYFEGWAARTARFAESTARKRPWLLIVCRRWHDLAMELCSATQVVVHGEYYPKNILYSAGVAFPVDWETAAVTAGEIDLACLTERWPDDVAAACELSYRRERWPEGVPDDFARLLDIARMYVLFRWLGERREWTLDAKSTDRFARLESLAGRLELI